MNNSNKNSMSTFIRNIAILDYITIQIRKLTYLTLS